MPLFHAQQCLLFSHSVSYFPDKISYLFYTLTVHWKLPILPMLLDFGDRHVIWELTQIVKLLSNFLRAVTDSFWSPHILLITYLNSLMTITDLTDVGGATDSDLTWNPLNVIILKFYTLSIFGSSNKTVSVRIAASCELQRLLHTSSTKGLNLNSMNYKICRLLINTRNFSIYWNLLRNAADISKWQWN
jgi:hypothetical protein